MSVDRAYTWVGSGEARVGNRWIERRWSRFLGQTTEFISGGGHIEWLREACGEFECSIDGTMHRPMDIGEISFSERCDARAAALEIQLAAQQTTLLSEVFVFHAWPGMLRRWWLVNRTDEELSVDAVRVEWLNTRWAAELNGARLVLRRGGSGLIFVAAHEACWTTVAEREYALELAAATALPGGARILLARIGILGFEGGLENALEKELAPFLEMLRKYEEEEHASQRLQRREVSRDAPAELCDSGGD